MSTLCFVLAAALGASQPAEPITVVAEWNFDTDIAGWAGALTSPLRVEDGALVFETHGGDAILVGPQMDVATTRFDMLEIRLRSSVSGRGEWFWRPNTEGAYGGFNAEHSQAVTIQASEEWQVVRTMPFWQALPHIIGLRFDLPEQAAGAYAIDSIRVLRYTPGAPVPLDFDFRAEVPGCLALNGAAEATAEGLRCTFPGGATRLLLPAVQLAGPSLVLDITGPDLACGAARVDAVLEFPNAAGDALVALPFKLAAGQRARYVLNVAPYLGERLALDLLLLGIEAPEPATLVLHAARATSDPAAGVPVALDAPATGLEFQTQPWRREYRLACAPPRIDVATTAPPETHAVASAYTVAMWYFAAWEPEYTWDGWKQVAERSPWRIPLLYDSSDPAMLFNGIQFYRASTPRVIDWHVHWMREHGVNLMLWDWYPQVNAQGAFDPTFFGNRAIELGFLGKEALGGPAVASNRFADTMAFAVLWTNHSPHNRLAPGLAEYIVDQFFSQANYYRMDGEPLLLLWTVDGLVQGAGGEEQAKQAIDGLRAYAAQRGHAGVYIAAVNAGPPERMKRLGIDGVAGYQYLASRGFRAESRQAGERTVRDHLEDYNAQSIPGHVAVWRQFADTYGLDYLVATTPMQNWEPTFRASNPVMEACTPDAYREMLARAKAFIEERGLRRFITIEAWNEWLEGSYVEPSTQWGLAYLEAIRDVFGHP